VFAICQQYGYTSGMINIATYSAHL